MTLAACSATYLVQNVPAFLLRRSARPPADGPRGPMVKGQFTYPDGSVLQTEMTDEDTSKFEPVDPELVLQGLWDSELEAHLAPSQRVGLQKSYQSAKTWIKVIRNVAFEAPMRLVKSFLEDELEPGAPSGTMGNRQDDPISQPEYVEILNRCLFDVLLRQSLSCAWNVFAPPFSNKAKSHFLVAGYFMKFAAKCHVPAA